MAEEATVKDAVAEKEAPAAKEPEKKEDISAAIALQDVDAAELGKTLMEAGFTKENLNQLLGTPKALESLSYLVQNDPKQFLSTLEKNDPKAGAKFLEKMAETYVERFGEKTPKGKEGESELMKKVEALTNEVLQFKTEKQQADERIRVAGVKSDYEKRVDGLFEQLPKDVAFTKSEQKAIRARLDKELGSDQQAIQRISSRNFIDVPKTFQSILNEWTEDKKAASKTETEKREKVKMSGFGELPSGPELLADAPKNFADSWDNTESAFGKAIERIAQ